MLIAYKEELGIKGGIFDLLNKNFIQCVLTNIIITKICWNVAFFVIVFIC